MLAVVYLTGVAAVFASVAAVHQAVALRGTSPAAFPVPGPSLASAPRDPLPACAGENGTAEEDPCPPGPGIPAPAPSLWGSTVLALPADLAPAPPPLPTHCCTCARANRTAPPAWPDPAPAPHCRACPPCPPWAWAWPPALAPPAWPGPLVLPQCSLEATAGLGRIKSFILPS